MKKLYLDHNVLSYLRTRKFSKNLPLEEEVKLIKKNYLVFFSSAHLEDIAASRIRNNTPANLIEEEIDFLTEIAENNSLRPTDLGHVIVYEEAPIESYKRVVDLYFVNSYAERIDKDVLLDAHENPLGDPREMNNISAKEILRNPKFRKAISNILLKEGYLDISEFEESLNWSFDDIKDRFPIFEYYINLSANLLEKLGYYREKVDKYRARLHDVTHIIYGAYCDVFVSADKKLLKKTQAIYNMLDIPTKVIEFEEFQNSIYQN